jgi:hypothetical protein
VGLGAQARAGALTLASLYTDPVFARRRAMGHYAIVFAVAVDMARRQ